MGTKGVGPSGRLEDFDQGPARETLLDAIQPDPYAISGGRAAHENDPSIGGIPEDVAPEGRPLDDHLDDGATAKLNG